MAYIPPPYPTELLDDYLQRLDETMPSGTVTPSAVLKRFEQQRRPFLELMQRLGVQPDVLIGLPD